MTNPIRTAGTIIFNHTTESIGVSQSGLAIMFHSSGTGLRSFDLLPSMRIRIKRSQRSAVSIGICVSD
ncbi:MAG: hypothetical protein C0439_02210 [Pseudomonas sp.]|nr:hypothetical protein [Pseudomonas sp.]